MKRLTPLLFLFILLALGYSACREHDELADPPTEQSLIEEARSYFETSVNTSKASINKNNPNAALPRTVAWQDAYLHPLAEGITAVAVPVLYDDRAQVLSNITNRNIALSEFTRLLVYKDKGNAWHAEMVSLLPQPGYSGKDGSPFAGIAYVDDWYGNRLKQFQCTTDGREIPLAIATNATSKNGRTKLHSLSVCKTTSGWNYSAEDPEGYHWTQTTCETYTFESLPPVFVVGGGGYGGSGGGGSGGSSGGGTSQPDPCPKVVARTAYGTPAAGGSGTPGNPTPAPCNPTVLPPVDIVNDVTDPCLKQVVEDFTNSNLMIRFMFEYDHTYYEMDLQYDQAVLDPTTAAWTKESIRQGNYIKISTRLNELVLKGSSREYIMATLIHEMIHAYQTIIDPTSTEAQNHEEMGTKYFSDMKNMLMDLFPALPPNQATALTWAGLEKTEAYRNWSGNKTETENWNRDFRRGTMGNKCE